MADPEKPCVGCSKTLGVVSYIQAVASGKVSVAEQMGRYSICMQCQIKDKDGVRLFRMIENKPYCGTPRSENILRNEKEYGCGCNLFDKTKYKASACPHSQWVAYKPKEIPAQLPPTEVALEDIQPLVITLDRRKDRLDAFMARIQEQEWPFKPIEVIRAVDVQDPNWPIPAAFDMVQNRGRVGLYGLNVSLIGCLSYAYQERWPAVLIMEDDAFLCKEFADRTRELWKKIPLNWDAVMLGGCFGNLSKISAGLMKSNKTQCTHAVIYREKHYGEAIKAYQKLEEPCDVSWSKIHKQFNIYAPETWLVGQAPSHSNISGLDTGVGLNGRTIYALPD